MARRLNLHLLAISLLAALPWAASGAGPGDTTGVVSVIDGDTIEIHGTHIRLHGFDAPEGQQVCLDGSGKEWCCGQKAALALADRIGRSPVSSEKRDMDRYGRVVGQFSVGGTDVNAWLVAQGLAVAYRRYSRDYVGQEDEARMAGRGIWSGRFVMPWDWRRGQRVNRRLPGNRVMAARSREASAPRGIASTMSRAAASMTARRLTYPRASIGSAVRPRPGPPAGDGRTNES